MKKELGKDATPCAATLSGGGSLKASLLKGLRRVNSDQENSDQVSKNYENSITGGFSVRSTLKNLVTWSPDHLVTYKRSAFTMAEILLSLTIIGVVAAITLPSLTGNINERTWNTQRKALYSRMSQAVSLMDSVRGYGTINVLSPGNNGWGANYFTPNGAEVFLSSGLSKVFKLNNICGVNNIQDCGFPTQVVNLVGSKINLANMVTMYSYNENVADNTDGYGQRFNMDSNAAAFETQNGESLMVYYNPYCIDFNTARIYEAGGFSAKNVFCANFIYDLNGKKGPNTVGKDVGFMTLLYPDQKIIVAPNPMPKNASNSYSLGNAKRACSSQGDDLRVPTLEEMVSIAVNYKLVDEDLLSKAESYATSTNADARSGGASMAWVHRAFGTGMMNFAVRSKSESFGVRCIKRY